MNQCITIKDRQYCNVAGTAPAYHLLDLSHQGKMAAVLFLLLSLCFSSLLMAHADEQPKQKGLPHSAIRIAMSAAFVSDSGIDIYNEIFHYLENKLAHKVEFISGFSYSTINSMLDSGMIDIGFICGLPYVMQRDQLQPGIALLVAPVMKHRKYQGKPIYYSYIIVHKDSPINNFSAAKGSRFVYNDEISNSGYNMPRAHLIDMGETSGFFSEVVRSGSHEESIRMVALGKSDISAVDSLVYDYDQLYYPSHVKATKIIETLGPAGIPPVVVSNKLDPLLRQKIAGILVEMNNDPAGKAILDKALIDRFIAVDDSNYDSIRKMRRRAETSGFKVIR